MARYGAPGLLAGKQQALAADAEAGDDGDRWHALGARVARRQARWLRGAAS